MKWGQGKLGLQGDKEKLVGKEPAIKKVKEDLSKVKCFNMTTMDIWRKIALIHLGYKWLHFPR